MAMRVRTTSVGVDVCKQWLDISDGEQVKRIPNTRRAIGAFLKRLEGPLQFALEPTQRYHEPLLQAALGAAHTVYLVDAYRLSRYREALGLRAKTDIRDAQLLHRYLQAERKHLRPYRLLPKAVQRLRELVHARAKLTVAKGTLRQSLQGISALGRTRTALLARLQGAIALIDRKLVEAVRESGYEPDTRRCRAIPGIGPLSSTALVATYHRGDFASADAFVAYMGLDLRVRESGRYRGQRKLSKRGDPELRRLLFNAARAGARTAYWSDYYQRLIARGFSTTAAYVALSRKLARLAYVLLHNQSDFRATATATA